MQQFCRTCGNTINFEENASIFALGSKKNKELLHIVRIITNCWLENGPGLPSFICSICVSLLKTVLSFRRRCTRIQNYLKHRRLNHIATLTPDKVQKNNDADPLCIEEIKYEIPPTNKIKKEKCRELRLIKTNSGVKNNHTNFFSKINNDFTYETSQSHVKDDIATNVSDEDDLRYITLMKGKDNGEMSEETKIAVNSETRAKRHSNKNTMRIGRRLVHVKMTNDINPKRIVDRDRQCGIGSQQCICEHCGRQFKDTSNLNVHLLRHSGTKNFECNVCNQKCYTLHLLRRHHLKHTEAPYLCTFCGVQYSTNSSRVRHEREACKKGRAPQSMTDAIKRGERTFHCNVCDLWFLRAGNLAQHINSTHHIENERRKKRKSNSIK